MTATATAADSRSRSGNPAFSERVTAEYLSVPAVQEPAMTRGGIVAKTFIDLIVLVAAGIWGWVSAPEGVAYDLGTGYGNVTITIPGGFWLATAAAGVISLFLCAAAGGMLLFLLFVLVASLLDWDWLYSESFQAIGVIVLVLALVLAALGLTLDFGTIDTAIEAGAPKYLEWYCAYGLMWMLIYLYLLILHLIWRLGHDR